MPQPGDSMLFLKTNPAYRTEQAPANFIRLWRPLNHRDLRREGSCTRSEQPVMTQFPDRSRTRPWTDHPRDIKSA